MIPLEVAPALESLEALRRWVRQAGEEAGLEGARVHRLARAVDEIATNAVVHGHATGLLTLRAEVDDRVVRLVLEDDGAPFDPHSHAPPPLDVPIAARAPGGLGIHLARNSVDSLAYTRVGGRNRNTFIVHRREPAMKGKIGVVIEEHFDPTGFVRFNEFFPANGYEVEYLTHLWGQPSLRFGSNPEDGKIGHHVTVTVEVNDVDPADYRGILLIGGYAMDRLRYQSTMRKGERNQAPAVAFLRRAVASGVPIGTYCHGLWLFCADPDMLRGRRVTCSHNIVCDVENAGAEVVYEGDGTAELVVDGALVTCQHPGVIERLLEGFLEVLSRTPV